MLAVLLTLWYAWQGALAEAVSGVYCGWASLGSADAVYKTAMSIGWNPFYNNEQKTAEPWLLHDFDEDFYGASCVLDNFVNRLSQTRAHSPQKLR